MGGTLPVRETLETMFESDCAASTDIFVVTMGGHESFRHGLEMVKLIKKNFSTRLMVRLDYPVQEQLCGQIYAAGADMADIAGAVPEGKRPGHADDDSQWAFCRAARSAFPRWSVASTLTIDGHSSKQQMRLADDLLQMGIVPLPRLRWDGTAETEKEGCAVLNYLVKAWRQHKVPIKPFTPLIGIASPLVQAEKPGALRTLFDRLHDRRQLAASDLLRHLRVSPPTDSLDSAEL